MKEPVLIQHDDDVEVFNNNAGPKYYQTRGPPTLDDEMWIKYKLKVQLFIANIVLVSRNKTKARPSKSMKK